jgi:hypothetical protein
MRIFCGKENFHKIQVGNKIRTNKIYEIIVKARQRTNFSAMLKIVGFLKTSAAAAFYY